MSILSACLSATKKLLLRLVVITVVSVPHLDVGPLRATDTGSLGDDQTLRV